MTSATGMLPCDTSVVRMNCRHRSAQRSMTVLNAVLNLRWRDGPSLVAQPAPPLSRRLAAIERNCASAAFLPAITWTIRRPMTAMASVSSAE